jgi:prepilin-type N-terminal cleavage/methylation domain-containing protein
MSCRRDNRGRRTRGFTLIEAIVAIVILSVGVPGLVMALADSHRKRVDPVMATRARMLASERLEQVIADRLSATRGYSYVTGANYPSESSITGFPGFSRTTTVTETGVSLSGGGTGYKIVQVTVTYTDGRGANRSVAVSTVVANYQ